MYGLVPEGKGTGSSEPKVGVMTPKDIAEMVRRAGGKIRG